METNKTEINIGSAYALFAQAIQSNNPNVKDALETLLMVTALTEGTRDLKDPFEDVYHEIAGLKKELYILKHENFSGEYPKKYVRGWSDSGTAPGNFSKDVYDRYLHGYYHHDHILPDPFDTKDKS